MAYQDRIVQTATQLANIVNNTTTANAAYMISNICTYLTEIVGHLERPGFLPRFIFSDDFETAALPSGAVPDAILGSWRIVAGAPSTLNWRIEASAFDPADGILHFDYLNDNTGALEVAVNESQPVYNSQNYELNVTMRVVLIAGVGTPTIGLYFRYLDSDQFYRLTITAAGVLLNKSLDAVVNSNVAFDSYTIADVTGLYNLITLATGTYDIRVVVNYGTWSVWVNGTQTHGGIDTDPLSSWYGDGAVGVCYRNVEVETDDYVLISRVDGT